MRKYRDGGYDALSEAVRDRIGELTGFWSPERDEAAIFTRGTPLTAFAWLMLCACMGAFWFAGVLLQDFLESDVHLAGRAYKFADAPVVGGPLLGIFAGIILSGVITAKVLGRHFSPVRNAATVIAMVQRGFGQYQAAEKGLQNYVLDRTPDDLDPDTFLRSYVRQSALVYWRVAGPMLVLVALLFLLDSNHYRRLALEGYRTSGYFQMGSTLHPLNTLQRIESGCEAYQRENGDYRGRLHYTLHFPGEVTLDLYDRDLKSNYNRFYTIEAYDNLLKGAGIPVYSRHYVDEEMPSTLDMDKLCRETVERRYKPAFHARAMAFLHLE